MEAEMRKLLLMAIAGLTVAATLPAHAVITHPVDDPNLGSISAPPADAVGRWSSNASAVAINPNYILTTRHQGGGVGTSVIFGGTTYLVAEVTNIGNADLRVARITTLASTPANLTTFVPVYTGTDEVTRQVTIGGYGRGRGTDLTTTGGTYGYNWLAEGNANRRFGRNVIDSTGTADDTGSGGFLSAVLEADFDGPGAASALQFEGILTEFDSGGGVFINTGGSNWAVAGLNRAVGHSLVNTAQPQNTALFASNVLATTPSPDGMDAVRLSSYATQINAIVPEPTGLALLAGAAAIAVGRRRRTTR